MRLIGVVLLLAIASAWQQPPLTPPLIPPPPPPLMPPPPQPVEGMPEREKASRTPEQRKIDTKLLFEIYRRQGQAARKNVPPGPTGVTLDPRGRALVDIRARVTFPLKTRIHARGGDVLSSSVEDRSIIAWIPVLELERLAANPDVRSILPAADFEIRRQGA